MSIAADLDDDARYRAVQSRDRRFDGVFWTGVRTTGIYCRPSCPAITPRRGNVDFYASAAAAQRAGLRACKRCLPDAAPGTPAWTPAAEVAHRAMRLIEDGLVDREGVGGLAARLGYSERQLGRLMNDHWGAGPLALARSRRAHAARTLVEGSDLPLTDIAFAAGFASVRQFNATVREVYDASPTALRARRAGHDPQEGPGHRVRVRLGVRTPYDRVWTGEFLGGRAVSGIETWDGRRFARTLRLPHGWGVVEVDLGPGEEPWLPATLVLADLRDLAPALAAARRLVDADADPQAVDTALRGDPLLRPLVDGRPGLRVPGHVDPFEMAVRAVLGQQVSEASARRLAAGLVERLGEPVETGVEGLTRLFPGPEAVAGVVVDAVGMPASRQRALVAVAEAVLSGAVDLDPYASTGEASRDLLAVRGIGPWTVGYTALRALADPDVMLAGDAGVRRAAAALGLGLEELVERAETWSPWRSYALMHLWRIALGEQVPTVIEEEN